MTHRTSPPWLRPFRPWISGTLKMMILLDGFGEISLVDGFGEIRVEGVGAFRPPRLPPFPVPL